MNKILSICIPTYNRKKYLVENLKGIIPQVKKYNIPIYISDNASIDGTEIEIKKLQAIYPYIFYQKSEENKGFDKNVLNVIAMSKTEYCWIFGDDDILSKDAIEKVYSIVKNKSLVVVNAAVYDKELNILIEEKRLKMSKDKKYSETERDKALVELANYTTYVGSLVIKKEEWDKVKVENMENCEDFIHITKVFNYILNLKEDIYVIHEPLIKIRYGNATWSLRSFKIWKINWPNTIHKTLNYTDNIKSEIVKLDRISIKDVILYRATKKYNFDCYKLAIKKFKVNRIKKLFLFLLAFFPVKILNLALLNVIYILSFLGKDISELFKYDLKLAREK